MAELKLLGGVVLTDSRGGSGTLTARRHPVALLALLATAPARTLSRAKLIGLLWPEVPERTARNRLTSCVYDVRAALGADVLSSAGDDVRLNEAALWCDVCRFDEAIAAADHDAAVELYGGPLLDGFHLDGSSADFEQLLDRERDRLRWDYQRALEALARQSAERGDMDAAVSLWRTRAADDPFDTRIAVELVRVLSASGNRREALRVAEVHTSLLHEELGAEPDEELVRLLERVRAADGDLAFRIADSRTAQPAQTTNDLEAFRLYVKGRALLDQRMAHEMTRAIEYFQRAIDRDPSYALAWSGLADALSLLEFYDYPSPTGAVDPEEAARRALDLDPALGAAHASLGIIQSIRQQGGAGLLSLERAVELSPDDAETLVWLAWVQLLHGSPREALSRALRAVELDPLSTPAYYVYLAEIWLVNGEPERALECCVRAQRMRPEYGLAHFMEALTLHHLRRHAQAARALERARSLVPPYGMPTHAEVQALEAVTCVATGDREAATASLARLRELRHHFSVGLVLAALGEVDEAFAAFDAVTDWRSFSNEYLRYLFPRELGPLRSDARYRRLLEKLERTWR